MDFFCAPHELNQSHSICSRIKHRETCMKLLRTAMVMTTTRWDVGENNTLKQFCYPDGLRAEDSQDTWIFQTPMREFNYKHIIVGTRGCDNRIILQAHLAGLT